ncbi:MAG TPA: phosphatidate cytidylyltransferase [Syntrophomonadaceae bacterium]|nr:phosphatidate cytidylyltransferase [Syntrophomonadaceae bacterium]
MLKIRILSSVVGIPILIGLLYAGGLYWTGLFTLLALVAVFEYLHMLRHIDLHPLILPALAATLILVFASHLSPYLNILFLLVLILTIAQAVMAYPRFLLADVAFSLFGSLYIGFLMGFALRIGDLRDSFPIMILCLLITWGSDTGGYAFGSIFGRHKMTPNLSPKKTWEGAIGALFLSALVALVFSLVFKGRVPTAYILLLGLGGSIMAQLGDLFESGIKRYTGVKDSSQLIPGHGGVLDRIDSFLLVLPLVYMFFSYVG